MKRLQVKKVTMTALSAAIVAAFAGNASAFMNLPTEHRYLSAPLQICDQGVFYIGGAPKLTPFGVGPTPGAVQQIIIGAAFTQFQVPMKTRKWPLIIIHGSGYTGTCVQGTAAGSEGWADHTVRNNITTYVMTQSGRGQSGFDKSVIHEAEYLLNTPVSDPAFDAKRAAGAALLPSFGGSTSSAWQSWFGHNLIPPSTVNSADIVLGTMIRHGALISKGDLLDDPLCATLPQHCMQYGRIPIPPDANAVDEYIAARTGDGAPKGLGTVVPDPAAWATNNNAAYLALEAYKFNVPNTEATLPGSTCPTCTPTTLNATNTWTPKAAARLVERIGGAIVATHSQSGQIGMNMVRVLKENGHLDKLKGLLQDEGGSNTAASGTTAGDFVDDPLDPTDNPTIPYLALRGDYTNDSAAATTLVAAIKALGGTADYIKLDDPVYGTQHWGNSHMHMIENRNLETMDVFLDWTSKNISNPPAAQKCVHY